VAVTRTGTRRGGSKIDLRPPKILARKREGVLTLEDLINEVELLTGLPREKAEKAVKTIFWSMIKSLRKRDSVFIGDLGHLFPSWIKSYRKWANFKKCFVQTKGRWTIKFRVCQATLLALNPDMEGKNVRDWQRRAENS
jgi:nucleoid DNA-binding protein